MGIFFFFFLTYSYKITCNLSEAKSHKTGENVFFQLYTYKASMLVLAGPQVVDGFFSLGGLLVSYSLLSELDAKKKMNFIGPIVIRFLRYEKKNIYIYSYINFVNIC